MSSIFTVIAKQDQSPEALKCGRCYYFINPSIMFGKETCGMTKNVTYKQFVAQVADFKRLGVKVEDPMELMIK